MISLDNFAKLAHYIRESINTKDFLSERYDIDIYPLTKNLENALDITLIEILPKDKLDVLDYFMDMIIYTDLTDDDIKETYDYIFNE
jgi:hypothetical protein